MLGPTVPAPLIVSSAGVSAKCKEFVACDAALMLLSRGHERLDHKVCQFLDLATNGTLKREVTKILEVLRRP